jgi:N6-L-threonylcarbamoyladenine synthase
MRSPGVKAVLVLGIESSCDETSAAVVEDGQRVISNIVSSQIPVHAKYGGVVPELASRAHVLDIVPTIEAATAVCPLSDIDAIAVTQGPGLVGSLLVGIEMAKALAYRHQLPLVGVNHVEAHLMAAMIAAEQSDGEATPPPSFPFVGLVVSGGHTSLYLVRDWGDCVLLGQTRDDAAGEALDKVGKMLGLGYPGGMHIDRLATTGDPAAFAFPRAMRQRDSLEFSFSGLKTAVAHQLAKLDLSQQQTLHDVCASVLEAVVDVLVRKSIIAAQLHGVRELIISGGVSANRRLRLRMHQACEQAGLRFLVPPRSLCTDNAGMIAGLGYHRLQGLRAFDAFDLNARASWPL